MPGELSKLADNKSSSLRSVNRCRILRRFFAVPLTAVAAFGVVPPFFLTWLGWKLITLPLPDWIYQWGDDILWGQYQIYIIFLFEWCTGADVLFDGDYEEVFKQGRGGEPKESVLYMSNHQSTMDWIVCDFLANRQGSVGHMRYVMKETLKTIPLYGYYFYQHGCMFVDRKNFREDRFLDELSYLRNPRITSWLVIFPEGTRYNPQDQARIARSESQAEKVGLAAPYKHHLTPRPKGTLLLMEAMRTNLNSKGRGSAVYNVSIVYDGSYCRELGKRQFFPHLFNFVQGNCRWIYVHVERIPISEVPEEVEETKKWLYETFRRKDTVLNDFFSPEHDPTEVAFARGSPCRQSLWSYLPTLAFMTLIAGPFLATEQLRYAYGKTFVFGTLFGYSWLALRKYVI